MPLGAVIARSHVMSWPPGAHGSTFGGNPVSCAAALVTMELIEQGYMHNAAEQGEYIREALEEMRTHHPALRYGRIDGMGLMVGAELVGDEKRTPVKELRNRVERCAIENGLLILGAGESTLRFCPALMIDRETVQQGLEIFDRTLTQVEQEFGLA
jgi:4-aminobutyrate aminotransferase